MLTFCFVWQTGYDNHAALVMVAIKNLLCHSEIKVPHDPISTLVHALAHLCFYFLSILCFPLFSFPMSWSPSSSASAKLQPTALTPKDTWFLRRCRTWRGLIRPPFKLQLHRLSVQREEWSSIYYHHSHMVISEIQPASQEFGLLSFAPVAGAASSTGLTLYSSIIINCSNIEGYVYGV